MSESRTWEQRHAKASETFAVFVPEAEPDRVAGSFAKRLGALGSFAFDVVGDMWARPGLSRRDRSLLVISTLAAQARDDELYQHTVIGIRNGLTRTEIEEIVLHVAAYAGFPAAMASARRIDAGLTEALGDLGRRSEPVRKDDPVRDRDAADVLSTITGGRTSVDPAAALAGMQTAFGDVGEVAYRWIMGEIWARPELSRRDRSIVVIAILTWLGAAQELKTHVRAGLHHGLSRAEIEEEITHLSLYSGMPRAIDAMRTAREVFASMETVSEP